MSDHTALRAELDAIEAEIDSLYAEIASLEARASEIQQQMDIDEREMFDPDFLTALYDEAKLTGLSWHEHKAFEVAIANPKKLTPSQRDRIIHHAREIKGILLS